MVWRITVSNIPSDQLGNRVVLHLSDSFNQVTVMLQRSTKDALKIPSSACRS